MTVWIAGAVFFLSGLSHLWEPVRRAEIKLVGSLQEIFKTPAWLGFFQEIWFFGRTVFVLVVLSLLTTRDWREGFFALLVYGLTAGVERGIKVTVRRKRPYQQDLGIAMHQFRKPDDPSFPSGDSLRVWYLALIIPAVIGLSVPGQALLLVLASLVALGRMILGVHYLTDVLSGSGLGMLGAALTLWGWNIIPWI